ncbi:TenA family transcriptional regulator [Burkholderia glumae]
MKNEAQSVFGTELVNRIKQAVVDSGINDNVFYRTFRAGRLPLDGVKPVFQQYYYYIRTFPQILAGLSHRVDNETIRLKLARTVVSELGDGVGEAHFLMFERVLSGIGVELDDYRTASYIPEATALVDGLRDLFLEKPASCALGAHYVIEEFGFPMMVALYEGFRLYPNWKHEDFTYFYLHMLVEQDHVEWIQEALMAAAANPETHAQAESGAKQVLALLNDFWAGLDRHARQYGVAA